MLSIVTPPTSPFRPPKCPIRSLPQPKQHRGTVSAPHVAAGQGIRLYTNAPLPPQPIHSGTPPLGASSFTPSSQPPPIGYTDAKAGRPQGLPPAAVGVKAPSSTSIVVGKHSKALPIINKQTGEAVIPQPLVPGAIAERSCTPVSSGEPTPIGGTPPKSPREPSSPAAADKEASTKCKVIISQESIANRRYTTEEMRSLRDCTDDYSDSLLKLVLSDVLPKLPPGTPIPKRLALLKDAPDSFLTQERGGFGAAAGNSLEKAAALRLRQVKEVHQKVMSVLSRITPEKYDALKKELMDLPLKQTDEKQLKQVVEVFFEKAVQEPVYSSLYAALVSHLCSVSDTEKSLPREEKDKLIAFRMRRELLNKCQEEFTKPFTSSSDELENLDDEEIDAQHRRLKKRLCGNIKFVCELYARCLVTDRVVDSILTSLTNANTEEDYVAEAIATTLMSAGAIFSRSQPDAFERHMQHCVKLQKTHPVTRIRFLMMDVEDCRKRGFEKKNKVLTHEELDRQQFEDQRKLQEDIDKAIRDQNRSQRRKKTTVASIPSSPVTPSRPAKKQTNGGVMNRGGADTPTTPTTPNSAAATSSLLTSPNAGPAPTFGYRNPNSNQFASTNSLSSLGPEEKRLSKEQIEEKAKSMMSNLATTSRTPAQAVSDLEEFTDKNQRTAILTAWLRRAVTSTKLFTEREQLPSLFAALLESEAAGSGNAFTTAELSKVLHDWAVVDIEGQQYDNCPRMFLNWAGVVELCSKHTLQQKEAPLGPDPAIVVHPGTLNLFLQELRSEAGSGAVESFAKDVLPTLDNASENNIAKLIQCIVSQPEFDENASCLPPRAFALLQRFRPVAHIAYVTTAADGNADDIVTKILANPKLKDDIEVNLYRIMSSAAPGTIQAESEKILGSRNRSPPLSPLHALLKTTSAALGVLLPHSASGLSTVQGNPFSAAAIDPDRAHAVASFLRSCFNNTATAMTAALKGSRQLAEHLCGCSMLIETIQHVAFAVSASTDHSVPSSPNTNNSTSGVPLPRSASTSGLVQHQSAQLEFEQEFATAIAKELVRLLVTNDKSGFIPAPSTEAVRETLSALAADVWSVSPPSSLRPTPALLAIGMDSRSASYDDLSISSPTKSGRISPHIQSPIHSKAIATSVVAALVAAQ